jgi:hypothetical protein
LLGVTVRVDHGSDPCFSRAASESQTLTLRFGASTICPRRYHTPAIPYSLLWRLYVFWVMLR